MFCTSPCISLPRRGDFWLVQDPISGSAEAVIKSWFGERSLLNDSIWGFLSCSAHQKAMRKILLINFPLPFNLGNCWWSLLIKYFQFHLVKFKTFSMSFSDELSNKTFHLYESCSICWLWNGRTRLEKMRESPSPLQCCDWWIERISYYMLGAYHVPLLSYFILQTPMK